MTSEVIKIGKIKISENHAPLIIAEIGINHNGNLKLAKKSLFLQLIVVSK